MNLMPKTTPQWLERGSLLLVGATLLSATAMADPNGGNLPAEDAALENTPAFPTAAESTFREALVGGNFWAKLNYRFETVDQMPLTKDARASTLQTRLGYETGEYRGMSGVLEFSNVANVPGGYDDYNDGSGSPANRPVIADPEGTVVNQVYMKYNGALNGTIKLGRQRIKLNKDRFVGNVGWRQTEQTYDALTYSAKYDSGLNVYYGYLDNTNNIFLTNGDQDSHILNLGMTWENLGTLMAYGYHLDFPNAMAASTFTYGARFTGDNNMGDFSLLYGIEIAKQVDAGDNPNNVDAGYSHAHLGLKAQGFTGKIGFETLDGSPDTNTARAFQTPLATKHAWNGWADKFLGTPAGGLEDLYFQLGYGSGAFSGAIIYHDFDAERSGGAGAYGSEIDAVVKYKVNDDLVVGIKAADYDADTFATDTQKFWLWMTYSW